MKISRLFLSALCITISINFASCSSQSDGWFQTNDKPADFNLFGIFNDYPSIKDGWDKVEADVFNSGLAELINNTPVDRLKDILGLMDDLVLDTDEPLFNTLDILQSILNKIVTQDALDDPADSYNSYYDDFLSFMETMSDSNANFSKNLVPIVAKLIMYINVTKDSMNDPTEITNLTNDLLYMLQEQKYDSAGAQNINYFLPLVQEAIGKLLMRNNRNMYVDNTGLPGTVSQRQDVSTIDGDDVDTGLGNTVEGLRSAVYGLNQLSQQAPAARTYLFDALLELGRLTSKDANGKLFKNVVKELLVNLEDYYTAGGSMASNADYNRDDTASNVHYYVNSEITNTVRELWPAVQLLMIRSKKGTDPSEKPDFSILKDDEGVSPLQVISKSLGRLYDIGIDFGTGGLESSLAEMVEKTAVGEDRSASDASYLDRLLFTLSIASNFGYLTRMSDSGEPQTNHGRGHGYSTGGTMTLNDSMYNMRSNVFMEQNAYSLALDKRLMQGYGVSRYHSPFTSAESASHKFYLGYDYPAFFLLPASCAGDAGIPNGGDTAVTVDSNATETNVATLAANNYKNDYRTYFPKVGNGIGETNTAAVMMGMIARICWEGEGPYYATAGSKSDTVNGVSGTVYYRPDGRIYAVKSGSAYYYPADGGNDSDQDSDGWRENRFYERVDSDYYLAKVGFLDKYCPPPLNTTNDGANLVVGSTGQDRFKMVAQDAPAAANRFMFWEKIHEDNADRACTTQEEAMYRNYQWLVNEKKFAFTIPMWVESLGMNSATYIVIEANGLAGLSLACKGGTGTNPADGNGEWLLQGDDGSSLLDAAELTRRSMKVNYGDSYELGDARIMVFCREDDAVTLDLLWQNILGKGHVLPDVIVQNFTPVPRMAFMTQGAGLASWKSGAGSWTTGDSVWDTRSRMFPLVVGAVGELHKRSYYDNSSGNNNYNYGGDHKYPIRTVLAALVPPLVKPWMRYIEDTSGAASDVNWGKRWAPRVKDESTIFSYLSPSVIWNDSTNKWEQTNVDLRPRFTTIKPLTTILTESGAGLHNGLIPLMTKESVLSNMMAMLQRAESSSGGVTDQTRESLFSGLEKVITSIRGSKGAVVTKEEASAGCDFYTTVDYSKLQWMFKLRYDTAPANVLDISLDSLLEEAIGFRDVVNKVNPADPTTWTLTTPGKGLCGLVNRRNAASDAHAYYVNNVPDDLCPGPDCPASNPAWDWSSFDSLMDGARSLMADDGPNGDTYYIMNDAVSLVNKFLSRVSVSKEQVGGLLHTVGILMATYDSGSSSWVYSDELGTIMSEYLPDIMDTFTGHYDDLMIIAYNMFKPGGLVESLLTGLKTSYPWSQVFADLNTLLDDPFFTDPSADPNLWIGDTSMVQLLVDMADLLGTDWYTRMIYYGPGFSVTDDDGVIREFDPYTSLGTVLSGGGE